MAEDEEKSGKNVLPVFSGVVEAAVFDWAGKSVSEKLWEGLKFELVTFI